MDNNNTAFHHIAESLASFYDALYYVDAKSGDYIEFISNEIYGNQEIPGGGKNFFESVSRNVEVLVHHEDRNRVQKYINQENIEKELEKKKYFAFDYRLVVDGKDKYVRLTASWSSDKTHFIVAVQNIDEEIRREIEHLKALKDANEAARRDELTGAKNKNAYSELEKATKNAITMGDPDLKFALLVCDLNDLKHINDELGHSVGDEYIKSACRMLFDTFSHSPVYRVGGDEFVVFLRNRDYNDRDELVRLLKKRVRNNLRSGEGPVIAVGISDFDPKEDKILFSVFDRADKDMYEDKEILKSKGQTKSGFLRVMQAEKQIPDDRLKMIDQLFEALSIISEGAYIYVCDMKNDFSRWSRAAVEGYGLPGEYMYNAGSIWEEHIHPDDRDIYKAGLEDIFENRENQHDMQYRARRLDGKYEVCTCKGLVIKDPEGRPDFFAGSIKNHGVTGQIDTLTGLRNNYGFLEDLNINMIRNNEMRICMLGISKFSEINEMYGYEFGNKVIQKLGRIIYEFVGNTGVVYRLDGTKFAVISWIRSVAEITDRYEKLRGIFREGVVIDDQHVIVNLCAGVLKVDNFDINDQTVYACLNFAYDESKMRRMGNITEFSNIKSDDSQQKLEKLYAIRTCIPKGFKGFYLVYQPVVDAQNERIVGAEALLRWKNKKYGVVPPNDFIPVLEQDPLFEELGKWILRSAIFDAKTMLAEDPDFIISVNLAYTQIEKRDFVDNVLEILEETGFPPSNLCLEITERCRLLDEELLKNMIVKLRGNGIKVALDDFGTGFSAVGLLNNLPFDIIKIDRSFVMSIEEDEKERKLIENFTNIASIYGAGVCVEGIENSTMRDILRNYSVKSFQGYYYSKPIDLNSFIEWMSERSDRK